MSGNGNQVPLAPSQRGSGPYPRASTPHRPECYHPAGATGGGYMTSGVGGAQSQSQQTLRVQPNPQPSAPPAHQQDMSKTTMSGHNFVPPQNSTPPTRPQYQNFQYRPNQHGSRTNNHPRPQQQFMQNASGAASAPVMYHPPTLVFQPHMVAPSYQQPRSTTPGYYQYVPQPYLSYSTPASHTPPFYYPSNNQPLPGQNLPSNPPGGRNNPTTMVGPQGTPVTATAPTPSLPHTQPQGHMHQPMPGPRPTKHSRRVPIIDPVTQQDILSDLYSDNNSQYLSGDSSERQTPQPESTPSIAEEFTRMVNEVAKQPTTCESAIKTSYVSKNTDVPISSSSNTMPPQTNTICSINNNIVKSELNVIEKSLGPDVAVESIETPVVSAISDSPVIVPKMPINNKQIPKSSEQQPVVVDTSKNVPTKQQKQNRSKPLVPQGDEADKSSEIGIVESVAPAPTAAPAAPQPQRVREPRERLRSEDKDKSKAKEAQLEPDTAPLSTKPNGPAPSLVISSVGNLPKITNPPTSHSIQQTAEPTKKQISKQVTPVTETEISVVTSSIEEVKSKIEAIPETPTPTATELLAASIEKIAKELPSESVEEVEIAEVSSAIQAQAKLTQSIASCQRTHQPESKMKDINLNNKTSDPDTANGNTDDVTQTETVKEDINKNEKVVKNTKNNNKKVNKMANNESVANQASYENGKEETDKISNEEQGAAVVDDIEKDDSAEAAGDSAANSPAAPAFVPKYKYGEDQWSPLNKAGKKTYDISLLKQIKEDPLSKNKPTNAARLEACNVIRASPLQDTPLTFTNISRPANDSLFPNFFPKSSGVGPRNSTPRDAKKDSRNMAQSGKGSAKLATAGGGGSTHKPVIHVSLSLREEVKLNQTKDAWRPARFKKENLDEEELKTQELYRKFRGILNKLTPQKFDTLLEKVKLLEINNQKRLEGVIDLVFEKAIEEPNFSEAYAAMCNKLSVLKVPVDNAPAEQYVNFRALIINKCQNQFVTEKVDENILKLEKGLSEATDPMKKRELQLMINEENRRVRMRSVGNVRFIGELYKLKMLTAKIMVFCMNHLIEKLEEEKLECLCKLLTTIGQQVESEVKEQLEAVFKKMQDIVERKTNKISSRVRFMIQDVIELRRRHWVTKNVVDLQPKMMDQIQKEADQQQHHIEMMNATTTSGGYRRDDGGRGKRGDSRRQNSNYDNNWKTRANYTVDTSKLKAATSKNINNIKLAPTHQQWNHGSGTKSFSQTTTAASNSMMSINNKYSMLENLSTDPATLRSNKDLTPNYSKGASIERSTFNSRGDHLSGGGSRSGSASAPRSTSSSRADPAPPPATVVPQEPLPEAQRKTVKSIIDLWLMNNPGNNADLAAELKHQFKPQHHEAVVTELLNVALEKTAKDIALIAKALIDIVATNVIAADYLVSGMTEILEFAPDLIIDIPMLYENLGKFIAPQIEKKYITFAQLFRLSTTIISSNHGHQLLKVIFRDLRDSMGPSFVKSKWQESGLKLKEWMDAEKVPKWLEENKFEFLEGDANVNEETKKILTPAQTQSKLLQLMNSDESCDCIKGWVQDNLGKASNEDWFMRALIQGICEHALFGAEGRDVPHFNQDRMGKYCRLINDFGDSREAREASCLFGIQQLIHRLEHPQGITLEIFQYLHEQYIISVEGFIAWEETKDEPEGKAVMLKALTSFFTNIKEVYNEDSCSED